MKPTIFFIDEIYFIKSGGMDAHAAWQDRKGESQFCDYRFHPCAKPFGKAPCERCGAQQQLQLRQAITDLSSMPLCVKEFGAKNVVFVADKGFYSGMNTWDLEANDLQYMIPLHRNNKMIDYAPIQKTEGNYFFYQNRHIWYRHYVYRDEDAAVDKDKHMVVFLDEQLRVSEENEYLKNISIAPEKYSIESFCKKQHGFGTITIMYRTKCELTPSEIYETYKQRGEIETMFDSYKNYLDADATYMQDRYVLEGWLLANFIAMAGYYKLFSRLKEAELLPKYSPKDIVERAKTVYMLKMGGEWRMSETTEKFRKLFEKIGIEYVDENKVAYMKAKSKND